MAENKDEQFTDEELAQLQLAEENENAVDRLVKELGCPTRRIRQFAARVLHLLAERDPQRVVPCVPALIEALDRPEAQTRWEALDALTALVTTCPEQLGDAFEGAETALFDEISSTLRYAAFRLLCVWGATSVERSREAWPILDEAIQCYHGDLEYRDMLGCLYEFCQGEIDAEVAEKLALRLKFDAENGKGSYLKARSSEIYEMLVKRFGLDLSKKKKRASVKKSDDAEDEE